MGYIHAIKGTVIALVVFGVLAWFVGDLQRESEGIEVILTISTFLFAILAGFFISRLNDRYNNIKYLFPLILCTLMLGAGCTEASNEIKYTDADVVQYGDPRAKECHIEQCHPSTGDVSCGSKSEGKCKYVLTKGDVCATDHIKCVVVEGECHTVGIRDFEQCESGQ